MLWTVRLPSQWRFHSSTASGLRPNIVRNTNIDPLILILNKTLHISSVKLSSGSCSLCDNVIKQASYNRLSCLYAEILTLIYELNVSFSFPVKSPMVHSSSVEVTEPPPISYAPSTNLRRSASSFTSSSQLQRKERREILATSVSTVTPVDSRGDTNLNRRFENALQMTHNSNIYFSLVDSDHAATKSPPPPVSQRRKRSILKHDSLDEGASSVLKVQLLYDHNTR